MNTADKNPCGCLIQGLNNINKLPGFLFFGFFNSAKPSMSAITISDKRSRTETHKF